MAIVDDTTAPRKEPSLVLQIALLAGLTVAALGIGWGSGMYLSGGQSPAASHHDAAPAADVTNLSEAQQAMGVVYLDPIMTNLAGPTGTRVRLEVALVFDGETDLGASQAVQQDLLAYLRTVKVHQIEGASGFQHLRSDIEERAAIRSEGKVKGILIKTLLFE